MTTARSSPNSATAPGESAELLDRRFAAEYEEHAAAILRMRKALAIGIGLWWCFVATDWWAATHVAPSDLRWFLAIRAFVTIPVGLAILRLRRKPLISPGALRVLEIVLFTLVAVAVGLLCVPFLGIESPYVAGALLVGICRSIALADPWRRGLLPTLLCTASTPATVAGAGLFVPSIADQLTDPASLGIFAVHCGVVLGGAAMLVLGGHVLWTLRRQVFEARSIGRYKLKKRIGAGGMGEVWSAFHRGLQRDVALKILRPESARDPRMVERFEREVRATTELTHPNTIRVYDYGVTEDGLWYYAMELLEGRHLGAVVAHEGPLDPGRAARLVAQAARALAEAHRRGLVHRDVKPANLFLTELGGEPDFLKVLDFGVVKFTAQEAGADLTRTGFFAGTPAYLSPEVAGGGEADARSDVYALGAVLYFLLTGAPPFSSDNPTELLAAHMSKRPIPPSQRRGEALPPAIEEIVMRCLAKDPAARYESAVELARALAESGLDSTHAPTAPPRSLPTIPAPAPGLSAAAAEQTTVITPRGRVS